MKTQIRQDMESRVLKGKSPSQQLRHALFEFWSTIKNDNQSDNDFDAYYQQYISNQIDLILSQAESVKLKSQENGSEFKSEF